MTTKEMIEILQAYEMGKEIEYRLTNESEWFNLIKTSHEFNFQRFIYRIKRWRAEKGEKYYYLTPSLAVVSSKDDYWDFDTVRFNAGNYFRTRDEAIKARELMLECLNKFHEEND